MHRPAGMETTGNGGLVTDVCGFVDPELFFCLVFGFGLFRRSFGFGFAIEIAPARIFDGMKAALKLFRKDHDDGIGLLV